MAKARCSHGVVWFRTDCLACREEQDAEARFYDPMPWWLRDLTVPWRTMPALSCRIEHA